MATTAERWETGRGDGSGIYLAGAPATRRKIGDFSEGGRSDSSEVCQARAQLAAAAPTMAHAIREAWRDLEDILTGNVVGGHPDIDDQTRRDLQATADALEAVLAKAEGR